MNRPLADRLGDGRYQVVRALGAGGEGQVVLAEDRLRGDRVVLKWRHDGAVDERPAEYEALARLSHPGIVAVLDVFRDRTVSASVMVEPWLEGADLETAMTALDASDLARLADQAVGALSFLHARGLRHGDIKPANLFVIHDAAEPRLQLIDFGMVAACRHPDWPGATPAYLAPELRTGRPPSEAMDWYALGLT
ncbi:MAG: protein kinase, partial [Planctomycetes bacterium]|nr:protein kinase [Planctomycetota bacterium]